MTKKRKGRPGIPTYTDPSPKTVILRKKHEGQGLGGGQPQKYTPEWLDDEADILLQWIADDKGVYIGTFCYERGYARQRLSEFAQVSNKFSDALSKAKQWQEAKFLEKGLTREWDGSQVRFTMARVCSEEWKTSFDQEKPDADVNINIVINKISR